VAHIVQANPGQPGGLSVLLEPVGDVVGVQRPAVGPGEHIAVVAVALADQLAVLGLARVVGLQRLQGDRIEGQAAPTPLGLGR
jgi:hypothetical protein